MLNLELESGLDVGHDVGRLLQLLDLGGGQDLLDHGGHTVGIQDAGQGQEHILINAVFALEIGFCYYFSIKIIQFLSKCLPAPRWKRRQRC